MAYASFFMSKLQNFPEICMHINENAYRRIVGKIEVGLIPLSQFPFRWQS
jgi:hypothetical protein